MDEREFLKKIRTIQESSDKIGVTDFPVNTVKPKKDNINSIYSVTAEHITIQSGRGSHIVIIEYEPRGKLIGNLDYIISFRHEAKVSAH